MAGGKADSSLLDLVYRTKVTEGGRERFKYGAPGIEQESNRRSFDSLRPTWRTTVAQDDKSIVRGSLIIPTLRKMREGWGTRQSSALPLQIRSGSVLAKDAVVLDAFDAGGAGAGYGFLVDHFVL
jgi:hypothetical protein